MTEISSMNECKKNKTPPFIAERIIFFMWVIMIIIGMTFHRDINIPFSTWPEWTIYLGIFIGVIFMIDTFISLIKWIVKRLRKEE